MQTTFRWLIEHLPAITILVGGLIAAGGAFWAEIAGKREARKLNLKPGFVILAGALIGLFGTLGGEFQTSTFQQKIIDAQNKLLTEEDHNSDLARKLSAKSDEIERLSKSNEEKSKKIIQLNEGISNSVTGGKSFCYLDVLEVTSGGAVLVAIHQGHYPLYSVEARFVDNVKFNKINPPGQPSTFARTFAADTNLHVGDLAVGTAQLLQPIFFSEGDRQDFSIFFSAHNGLWSQRLKLTLVEGKWLKALRVSRLHGRNSQVLLEKIDREFPAPAGKIDWQ